MFKKNPAASIKVLRSIPRFQNFIKNLTDINALELKNYVNEITSKKEFQGHLRENLSYFNSKNLTSADVGMTAGMVLYIIARKMKPNVVVETGTASGVSSAYILCALDENEHGKLCSIDLPYEEGKVYPKDYFGPRGATGIIPKGKQSGWIIPNYLRHRWRLILGRSSEKLPPLLEELGPIDIFIHDSEHSYQNMLWEYQTAWPYLNEGGILLSHNADENNAFSDFCQHIGGKRFILSNMGGVVKAHPVLA